MIRIDPEFENLIPPLTEEEFSGLKENILSEGVRDPLVVWKNGDLTLLDGHNRHRICEENDIHFNIIERDFEDREDAKTWIIQNQFGRRNLNNYQRSVLALQLEGIFRNKAKEKQSEAGGALPQKSAKAVVDTRNEVAKAAGVSHDTIAKAKVIQEKATKDQKVKLESGQESINRIYTQIKREEIRKYNQTKTVQPLPENEFDLIYCDPPWRYEFPVSDSRQIENHYPTMDLEEIKNLEVPAAKNCVLLMWATAPKLDEALQVMKAWDFNYRSCAVWDKEKMGMGYWFRIQHELLLVGVRGKYSPPSEDRRIRSIINETRTGHSKKPETFYSLIESMFPSAKKIELFARKKRDNWVSWGNEVQ